MDPGETQYLFKETRLNLEPPSSSSVVTIRVSPQSNHGHRQRKADRDGSIEDETTFRQKNLATASSIYHRQWHDSPRSFLWRVLEDGTVLSIRAVDVYKKAQAADAPLILNFHFSVPIQPGCVAFSDPEEHDSLCLFVLDQTYQLYTFTLRPDLFKKRAAVDAGLSELGKVQTPAGLGFKHPHRMVAVTAETLLVTVNDGGMIRLDKNKSNEGRLKDGALKEVLLMLTVGSRFSMEGVVLQCAGLGTESAQSATFSGTPHNQVRQGQHGVQFGHVNPGHFLWDRRCPFRHNSLSRPSYAYLERQRRTNLVHGRHPQHRKEPSGDW